MYLSLIQNAALLVALSTLYGLHARLWKRDDRRLYRASSGLLFGLVAIAGMLLPYHYQPGIIYDGRSIIMAMAGLFGGGTGSAVAVVVAGAYRAYMGGAGVWAGLATIVVSALAGLAFRRVSKNRPETLGFASLYGLGISVHVLMLLCQLLLLPWPASLDVFRSVWLPIILVFPVATVFIGFLLGNEGRRIQGARDLRESEERHRLLADNAGDVIWTMDTAGRFTYVSPSVEKLRGYSVGEVMQQSMSEALTAESAAIARSAFAEAIKAVGEGRPCPEFRGDLEQPRKDGSTVWTDLTASAMMGADGEFIGFLGVTRDITERKRAEEALQKSEEIMRFIIKHDPSAIAIFDRDLRYIAVSDRYLTDYGIVDDLVVGKHHYEVFPELPQKWRHVHQRVLAGAIEREKDDSFERADGAITYNSWECRPWYEPDGSIGGIITYTEVTTERKLAEEALRERDEQLRQSQKMEAVGQLAGGIAHDFNNLLTAIIGYSDLLLTDGGLVGISAREDVREIKAAADRASSLTRQILAFSRRQALRPTIVSPNHVVAGMETLLRRTLGENIDLVTLPHPDLGRTEVDPHQFEQVLMNLAVNARDAMPAGGKLTLETTNIELDDEYCRTHPDAEPGSYVMLVVSDTGMGMDSTTMTHVFEPFFTTKPPGAGTGLGLSTVYGIVRQSGGVIDVSSELGRGTSFRICLPRATSSASAEPLDSASASWTQGHETILVVEDEEALRRMAVRILGGRGYQVLTAATAAEALEIAAEEGPALDLLLTDVVLPGVMQGNDLARSLTSIHPDLPVLYMSGYTRDAIVHAGRLDEGIHYLQKPFTSDSLAAMVREVLDLSA